jgi:hypothetical protein
MGEDRVTIVLDLRSASTPFSPQDVVGRGFGALTTSPERGVFSVAGPALRNSVYLTYDSGSVGVMLNAVPDWIVAVQQKVAELSTLRPGWDGQSARSISRDALLSAWEFIVQVTPYIRIAPSLVPTVSGGVALEWHRGGFDIEVDFSEPEHASAYIESESGMTVEGYLDQVYPRLVALIRELT